MAEGENAQTLPHFAKGIVVKGFGRGSKRLGIPTANFSEEVVKDLPFSFANGIYYGYANVSKGEVYPMVMSVGWNPTYDREKKSMETHILHVFDEDFYGEELRVCVIGYLRDEKKFNSEGELVEAIHGDIAIAKEKLKVDSVVKYKLNSFFHS